MFYFRKNRASSYVIEQNKKIIFILKVYKEENLIKDTIDYYRNLINRVSQTNSAIELIIVGTEMEKNLSGTNTTLLKAKSCINNNDKISIIELPNKISNSSQQLNFAVSKIDYDPEKTWIYLLDIDTRIDERLLMQVFYYINEGNYVIQAHSLFLNNFKRINFLEKPHALYQSKWTLTNEIYRVWLHNRFKLSLAHVVGHGLCINLGTLINVGYFPTELDNEDIHLGFNLVALKYNIKSLYYLENGDNPKSLKEGIIQEFTWSMNAFSYPLFLELFLKKNTVAITEKIRLFFICLQAILYYIIWNISAWYFMLIAFVFLFKFTYFYFSFFIFYFFEHLICYILFYKLGRINRLDLLLSPIYFFFGQIRRSLGANLGLMYIIKNRTLKRYKTQHE